MGSLQREVVWLRGSMLVRWVHGGVLTRLGLLGSRRHATVWVRGGVVVRSEEGGDGSSRACRR